MLADTVAGDGSKDDIGVRGPKYKWSKNVETYRDRNQTILMNNIEALASRPTIIL